MKTGVVSRADLLLARDKLDEVQIDALAAVFQFDLTSTHPQKKPGNKSSKKVKPATDPPKPQALTENIPNEALSASYWRVTARDRASPEQQQSAREVPEYIRSNSDDIWQETPTASGRSPEQACLLSASQLWPLLRRICRVEKRTGKLDVRRLVDDSARLEVLRELPLQRQQRYHDRIQLLVDCRAELMPFRADFDLIVRELTRWRGRESVAPMYLDSLPTVVPFNVHAAKGEVTEFKLPHPGQTLYLLTDAGTLSPVKTTRSAWQSFTALLLNNGVRVKVLSPLPGAPALMKSGYENFGGLVANVSVQVATESLLTLIAPLLNVTPALLRDIRQECLATKADTRAEYTVWNNPVVVRDGLACSLNQRNTEALQNYRQRFRMLARSDKNLMKRYRAVLAHHRRGLNPLIELEELVGIDLLEHGEITSERLHERLETLARSLFRVRDTDQLQDLKAFIGRSGARLPSLAWNDERLALAWACANLDALESPPAGLNQAAIEFLQEPVAAVNEYVLCQRGDELVLRVTPSGADSPIATIRAGRLPVSVVENTALGYQTRRLDLQSHLQFAAPFFFDGTGPKELNSASQASGLTVESDIEKLTMAQVVRPSWATAIYRNKQGLYVESASGAGVEWPDWADDFGLDEYGIWAEFTVGGVIQRMRWIEPGHFIMGSPTTEEGSVHSPAFLRGDQGVLKRLVSSGIRGGKGSRVFEALKEAVNENYALNCVEQEHEVELTVGYWLADTACTQALWSAVMKSNPSEFEGDQRPVENISYIDVQGFLRGLSDYGLDDFDLPTEAQWEYACRAGTGTPFYFGSNVSTEQANYNGNYPYAGGVTGENRESTIEVKGLPASHIGLYQMHGNVWEWCRDWLGPYRDTSEVDPVGAEAGDGRVVRGGGWVNGAEFLRSGRRGGNTPDFRSYRLGFRLVRGQRQASADRTVAAERWRSGGDEEAS